MDYLEKIHAIGKCCACETPLADSKHVNMVQVDKPAKWPYPVWGNFLTGHQNMAVAFICDSCYTTGMESGTQIKFAVEIDTEIKYHAIESL